MLDETMLPPDAPAPRLCHLIKWQDFDGYGFNLHAEKSKSGQFVGKVDEQSPAQAAGLREGDRIIEVNGVNIANENHRQVVERIKANPRETKLLVIEELGDLWYKERALVIRGAQENVIFHVTPERMPYKVVEGSAAVVCDDATQSQGSGDGDQGKTAASSTGANDCVKNESEVESAFSSPSSPSPSSVSAELKAHIDSQGKEEEEESKPVATETQTASEPEIVDSNSSASGVFVTYSGDSKSLLEEVQEAADKITAATGADQKEDMKEASAPRETNPIATTVADEMEAKNDEVVVIGSSPVVADSPCNGQKDPYQFNNNNTIGDEAVKGGRQDVVDSITIQVKSNGVSSCPTVAAGSASESPTIPASPTSLKSNSSGSTSGNALSSLGSGGEGKLEMSLNMSVSQMRQMLAQKKKVDPKKVAMDLKQKYEIISSM